LKLEFHGTKVTSDAGLLAYRELDEKLGLTALAGKQLVEPRQGKHTQYTMTALLRQAVYGRVAGYEDTNDAERLRVDPAMRHVPTIRGRPSHVSRYLKSLSPHLTGIAICSIARCGWTSRALR